MLARAQACPVMFPGKENCEPPKATVKPKPADPLPASALPTQPGLAAAVLAGQGDEDLDGIRIIGAGGGPPLPPPPAQPKPAAWVSPAEAGAMSKKSKAAAKRAAGVGWPAAKGPFWQPQDSSEDEESDADSVAGDGAASAAEGGPQHKAKKPKRATPAAKGTL